MRVLVLVVFALATSSPLFACTCSDDVPFVQVYPQADLVVRGKVVSYGPLLDWREALHEYMTVKVVDTLAGYEESIAIRVYGDTGSLCRPYITPSYFGRGREYVLAVFSLPAEDIETSGRLSETPESKSYWISACGEYWLPVHGERVIGRIESNVSQSMPYRDFLSILEKRETSPGAALKKTAAPHAEPEEEPAVGRRGT